MGALGGIRSLRGDEIDPAILGRLSDLQAQIGPDGVYVAEDRGVACLFRPSFTHPESCAEKPFRAENGDLLIFNGRLDNRDELTDALGVPSGNTVPTEALVHRAFERWGLDTVGRLLGDFSLSYWQADSQRLVLATDIWALRPVFYRRDGDRLAWSSRCRALLDALELPAEPDPHYVASFLIRPLPGGHSPFVGIDRVPPAHYLVADASGIELRRYWAPDPDQEIRYARDEEYEEHYREVFERSVACRASSSGPVFAELSGGYDSSSIVCVADALIRQGKVSAPSLETVSYVYDQAPTADERAYISPVEEQLGRQGFHIANEDTPLLAVPPADESFRPDFPAGQLIYFRRNEALAEQMTSRGSQVLLRGMGGDQVTWGDPGLTPWEIGDHLVRGQWRRAYRASRDWSLALGTPHYATFWRGGLWPLMPRQVRRRTFGFALPVEKWFVPDFVQGLDLRLFSVGMEDDVGFRLPSRRQQFTSIREVATVVGWEFLARDAAIDCRFPFLDRRLVEFALATPIDRMLRPKESRSLARRAMRGILPEKVRRRLSKAGPDEAVYRTIARQWKSLAAITEDPLVSRYGFVDRKAFRETLHRVRHGVNTVAPQLTRTFALEFWLRSLDCRQTRNSERLSTLPPIWEGKTQGDRECNTRNPKSSSSATPKS